MNRGKRLVALVLGVCMSLSILAPCALANETEYATREYVVSEFVQSVGRSNLEKSDAVLEMFSDADDISEEYQDDISRAIVGGILKGYDDHTIKPSEPIKRIEAMVMLARCVPELAEVEEAIEFSDVPEWAAEDIAYLSKAGLVKGYGDGKMGADDLITVEQVGLLVERSDEALRLVSPGDSFYGYVNEKTFRNATVENTTTVDPIHGAIIANQNSWSHLGDVYNEIVAEEEEILNKLMNGELEMEKGSAEQRVHDMLECIDADVAMSESDKQNITGMRNAIINAESIEELLAITSDIYRLAGINVLFDVAIDLDKKTGIAYPSFSIATAGDAGFLAYRKSTDTDEYREVYQDILSGYLKNIGADFTDKDIKDAIELQEASSKDYDYYNTILMYLAFAQMFGVIDEEAFVAELEDMAERHSEFYDEESGMMLSPTTSFESKDREDADATFAGFDLCEELSGYGFTNLEKIIVPTGKIAKAEKDIISEENLEALKINALLVLGTNLGVSLTEEEKAEWDKIGSFSIMVCLMPSAEDLAASYEAVEEGNVDTDEAEDAFEENVGVEYDEGILSAINLNQLRNLMPNDIGLLYTSHYYDDEISNVVGDMFHDIWDAYEARFEANTWMKEETKENAIKKLDNMLAVVAYPDNYTFPEIVPMSEGGTLFSNTLSIRRNNVADIIRCNEDKEFIRTQMLLPPDEVNACYIPVLNTINVPAGILNAPMYDVDASYAANLGSIGMIIAHEIGHAFDKSGSQFDENGCEVNWWTEEDSEEFQKIQDYFVEYYNRFEVVDGVVQDANITITENMADFAAMQVIMDIIGDDQEAQKECFEAYANMWAQLGTESYLTDNSMLADVHAANVVRVNAVVASFDQFYEIYDVTEGDAMYVEPDKRLKLW